LKRAGFVDGPVLADDIAQFVGGDGVERGNRAEKRWES
jgi:hypothetical protein